MDRLETDFLFAQSSFLSGFGSVLNINGHFHEYNRSENPDEIAIAADWRIIGQDIQDALNEAEIKFRPASTPDNERK